MTGRRRTKTSGSPGPSKFLFNKSLRFQLTLAFIGLAVAPLLFLGLVISWQSYNTQDELVSRLESQIAKRISTSVYDYIKEFEDELWTLDTASQLSSLTANQQKAIFTKTISREDGFANLTLLDKTGSEKLQYSRLRGVVTSNLGKRINYAEFTNPFQTGQSYYSPIRFDDVLGEPLMTLSIPTINTKNQTDGVLAADVRLKKVWDLIADIQLGQGERVYIVDDKGKVVAHKDPSVVFRGTTINLSSEGQTKGLEGKNVILAKDTISLGSQKLYAIAEIDSNQAFSLTYNTIVIIASLTIFSCFLAGAFIIFMLKKIIIPIESLEKTAQAIAAGDLDRRAKVYSLDEIGRLAVSFNETSRTIKQMYDQIEEKVKQQTAELSIKVNELANANTSLMDNKKAMLNLLEDAQELEKQLEQEKSSVEKKVEERTKELANAKANLSASIDNLPLGFLMTDVAEKIIVTNSTARKVLGGQNEQLYLSNLKEILNKKIDLEEYIKNCNHDKKRLAFNDVENKGRYFQFLLSPILVKEEDNACIGIVVLIQDVTEAKILDRSKDEFFSIASHELRTPLTAIRGNTALMKDFFGDSLKDPSLREIVDDIHESSQRLIEIVNDFLDMSRLEQGRVTYDLNKISIHKTIEKVVYEMSATTEQKCIIVKIDKSIAEAKSLPDVIADEARLKQILYNLIGNAVKYTPSKGSITIGGEANENQVKITVSDNGQGIAPKMQPLLFHKFQQAGESLLTRDASGGTGLGLYISKLLAEGMGGKLYLEHSELGKGSTFAFELPLAKKESKTVSFRA